MKNDETIKFAYLSDTHIGSPEASHDLANTVSDINAMKDIDFVVVAGDITEFGSDEEFIKAKQLLEELIPKWYVIHRLDIGPGRS